MLGFQPIIHGVVPKCTAVRGWHCPKCDAFHCASASDPDSPVFYASKAAIDPKVSVSTFGFNHGFCQLAFEGGVKSLFHEIGGRNDQFARIELLGLESIAPRASLPEVEPVDLAPWGEVEY